MMLLGSFIVAAVLLSPFLGIFIVAAHVSFSGQPQRQSADEKRKACREAASGRRLVNGLLQKADAPTLFPVKRC